MPLELDCPGCQKHYSVPDTMAGKKVKCKCGTTFEAVAAVAETDALEELSDDGGLSSMDDLLGDVGVSAGSSDPFGGTDVLGMSSAAADPLAMGGTSAAAKTPGAKATQTAANEAAANQLALTTGAVIGGVAVLSALICLFLSGASLAMLMLFIGLALAGFAVVACMVGIEKAAWPLVGAHGLLAVVGLGFGIYHYSQREQVVVAENPTTPTTDPNAANPNTTNPTTTPMIDPVTGKPIDPENTHPPMPNPMPMNPDPATPMKPEGEKPTTPATNITTMNVAEDWEVKFTRALEPESTPSSVYLNGAVTTLDKLNAKIAELKQPVTVSHTAFTPWLGIIDADKRFVLWNLSSGTSPVELPAEGRKNVRGSFDMRYFYTHIGNQAQISLLENGQKVADVPESLAEIGRGFDIVGGDRLLLLVQDTKTVSLPKVLIKKVSDLSALHEVECPIANLGRIHVHGNGRYIALLTYQLRDRKAVQNREVLLLATGLTIIDTSDGTKVAELHPKAANYFQFLDGKVEPDQVDELAKTLPVKKQLVQAAFSPDGHMLAILELNEDKTSRILLVQLSSGNLTEIIDLEPAVVDKKLPIRDSKWIQWTPNGASFLLFGRTIVSRVTGKSEVQIPDAKDQLYFFLSSSEMLRANTSTTPPKFVIEGTP